MPFLTLLAGDWVPPSPLSAEIMPDGSSLHSQPLTSGTVHFGLLRSCFGPLTRYLLSVLRNILSALLK